MENQQHKHNRAEQSRINGAKSKGPKTETGKANSKKGNYKHAGYACSVVALPDEEMSIFDNLLADAKVQFQPRNFFESQLVEEVVELTWQINRLRYLVTAHVNAAMIDRRRKVNAPTRIDQDKLAGETGGATPNGAITVLERHMNRFIQQRSKIMADIERLKKTSIPIGPTREPEKTKDIEDGWDFQLHDSPPPGYVFEEEEQEAEEDNDCEAENRPPKTMKETKTGHIPSPTSALAPPKRPKSNNREPSTAPARPDHGKHQIRNR